MLSKDVKTAIALGAGALYVYVGIQKEEAANWTFDALLVVGLLLIGTILYGLFKKGGGGARRRGTRAPFARPYASPIAPGNAAPVATPAPARTQPPPPPAQKSEAAPFSTHASDSLAEWTTTAPGQNSWNPTLVPIQQKPGAPVDVQGFSFK
jgi:hypothetical protein